MKDKVLIDVYKVKTSSAEHRALKALTRGTCGTVSDHRVWCDADPTGTLLHKATFDRLVDKGLVVLKRHGEYKITLLGLAQIMS